MTEPLTAIRNVGPAMAAAFARVGIPDAEALRQKGADQAYLALLQSGERPHFIAYYALVMGLQGRPWNDCRGPEKDALRVRFDALKAESQPEPLSAIESVLDRIGVRPAR